MVAAIVLLLGLMFLVTQLMLQGSTGEWPSITLSSELGIPADRVFSDWWVVDAALRFVLGEVQLWTVLVFAAAVMYWVTDFTDEMLSRLGKRAPPALSHEASELADGGSSL